MYSIMFGLYRNRISCWCSNKNFDSKVTGDNQTTTENVSDILNDQEKKEGGLRERVK